MDKIKSGSSNTSFFVGAVMSVLLAYYMWPKGIVIALLAWFWIAIFYGLVGSVELKKNDLKWYQFILYVAIVVALVIFITSIFAGTI